MEEYNFFGIKMMLDGKTDEFDYYMSGSEVLRGLYAINLKVLSKMEAIPPKLTLTFTYPSVNINSMWSPTIGFNRGILPEWCSNLCKSNAVYGAPVQSFLSYSGENKLTIAVSDALNKVELKTGLMEESANLLSKITFFDNQTSPIKCYETIIRLDTRSIPYYDSLDQVEKWWASMSGYKPAKVPQYARLPMYSTWYSFHQNVDKNKIIEQCKIAKEIGCESIIIDDGWQTDDNNRGYAYCGDWKVANSKIPDMKEFVEAVHESGLKILIWYSVPFVGKNSEVWERFKGKYLYESEHLGTAVLDPRFPEVREYLINTYENAANNWNLDGLKLDFVDSFNLPEGVKDNQNDGKDYSSVVEAVDRLLKDTMFRLRSIKPDFMIEFRQGYIGPLMRTYGNMFRAGDCPNDSLGNRVRVLDIRLLCGNTATHSDMLMWNNSENVEGAAMQIINVLYSVPQISVLLDKIPYEHFKMLKYWIQFWRDNKDVLIDGKIEPLHPEANYSSVVAYNSEKVIATVYSSQFVVIPNGKFKKIILVNGSFEKQLILQTEQDYNIMKFKIHNCMGELTDEGSINLKKGRVSLFEVPPSGNICLSMNS